VPELCPERTDRADCALSTLQALGVQASGRLFCETADFFNNTVAAECEVQPCCEWLDGQGCLSTVGDESCDELDDDDDDEAVGTATAVQVPGGMPSGADVGEEEDGEDDEPMRVLELGVVAAGLVVLGAAFLVARRKRGDVKEVVDEEKGADGIVRDSTAETATLQGSGMVEHSEANP
jgi:hypothetical protein